LHLLDTKSSPRTGFVTQYASVTPLQFFLFLNLLLSSVHLRVLSLRRLRNTRSLSALAVFSNGTYEPARLHEKGRSCNLGPRVVGPRLDARCWMLSRSWRVVGDIVRLDFPRLDFPQASWLLLLACEPRDSHLFFLLSLKFDFSRCPTARIAHGKLLWQRYGPF
jgi:hypothetical protein